MYFEVGRDYLKVWNKGLPNAILTTPRTFDSGESIFEFEYLLEFEAKIDLNKKNQKILIGLSCS